MSPFSYLRIFIYPLNRADDTSGKNLQKLWPASGAEGNRLGSPEGRDSLYRGAERCRQDYLADDHGNPRESQLGKNLYRQPRVEYPRREKTGCLPEQAYRLRVPVSPAAARVHGPRERDDTRADRPIETCRGREKGQGTPAANGPLGTCGTQAGRTVRGRETAGGGSPGTYQ